MKSQWIRRSMIGQLSLSLALVAGYAPAQEHDRRDAQHAPLLETAKTGLTAEAVAQRATTTSFSARAADQSLAQAAAQVDAAWAAYLPRLTGAARYTRHSAFTPPLIAFGDGPPAAFPLVLNQWSFQASVVVPLSDYAFRIRHAHASAEELEASARFDGAAARARAASEGKLAFYGWLTARAGVAVARATLELQKTLLVDAQSQFAAGNASRADVLQAESSLAASELFVTRAESLVHVAERKLRLAIHASADEELAAAEDLERDSPPLEATLPDLIATAERLRPELASLTAAANASRRTARASSGAGLPALSLFGDAAYANPNARRFPQRDEWFGTWAVGAQLTWSPNDVVLGGAGSRGAEARAAELEARQDALRDAIELEVTQAYHAALEADAAVGTIQRQLASAREAFRVAQALFASGRATATQVREAETAFTRARLEALYARASAKTSRVQLEYAVGGDERRGAAAAPTP